jgi:hypothetical protein
MIQGGLFTRDFLSEGIVEEEAWRGLDDESVRTSHAEVGRLLNHLVALRRANEAETEKELIFPLLAAIGWQYVLPQQNLTAGGRQDVPDGLMFGDERAYDLAAVESAPWKRFQHGLCVLESKRWGRPLDREDRRPGEEGVPSTQMLRYLRRIDDVTEGRLRWGVLTNGRLWRLYWQGALSVSEDFLEIDLGKIFELPGCEDELFDARDFSRDHAFKLFLLFFGQGAFTPNDAGRTFHERALQEGRFWEERVARNLSNVVFGHVFPALAAALGEHDRPHVTAPDERYLAEVREGALILLYRLLFVLYAEDRNLLPDESGPYSEYALTRIRQEIADARSRGRDFSARSLIYWAKLKLVFEAIAHGDDALGIPEYNGGLFDSVTTPILERVQLPDSVIAELVFRLSHEDGPRGPKYINYRDLSVQQLGSIYERILEFGLKADEDGRIILDEHASERKDSGSYYTPEALVSLIIEHAVGPLADQALDAFERQATALAYDKRPVPQRLAELAAIDPASRMLDLRVCDPAMGSGHFLVSLVDWLADRVLAAMAEAAVHVTWSEDPYVSPLAPRIAAIRARILEQAKARRWPIAEEQLDDRHVVRRMILKRVVHGVDKNPMAVELAKVALWLHTFTVGAPLSFLDHHLRCGDSVVGAWVRPTLDAIQAAGGLLSTGQVARIESVSAMMTEIEQITDNDISEVEASKEKFAVITEATGQIDALFSLMTARNMLGGLDKDVTRPRETAEALRRANAKASAITKAQVQQAAFDRVSAFRSIVDGEFGDPLQVASGEVSIPVEDGADAAEAVLIPEVGDQDRRRAIAASLVGQARALAARERFLNWEIAFPHIWQHLASATPAGGFDAVIGNPPYVRQELLAAIKPALKFGYATYDGMADLYVYFYEQGLRLLRPGGRMSYVVTNKWLKAGYAEELRSLFSDPTRAEVAFIADFGHAKHFFPDADVFPSVIVVKCPDTVPATGDIQVCVIPREAVPTKGLSEAVHEATFPLPRAMFSKGSWVLEPRPVVDLIERIKRSGTPLIDYVGIGPQYGIKTGLNEAFVIDTAMRDRLIVDDPRCSEIIKPYLRGQDVSRWDAPWSGLWMIFTRRGIDINSYPAVLRHLQKFRRQLEPRPIDWRPSVTEPEWPGRKAGTYAWFEIQDSVEYWRDFEKPKIVYPDIAWTPSFALDETGIYVNNTGYFLPSGDPWLAVVLNAPVGWWYSWRKAQHAKDEALRYFNTFLENYPVPRAGEVDVRHDVNLLTGFAERIRGASGAIQDWVRLEFGVEKFSRSLSSPRQLSADAFAAAVRAALPQSRRLSVAEIARLKAEHATTLGPAQAAATEAAALERRLSDLVNEAYQLTADDVRLMWQTAPPRMPFMMAPGVDPVR